MKPIVKFEKKGYMKSFRHSSYCVFLKYDLTKMHKKDLWCGCKVIPASFSSYASFCGVVYEHQNLNSDYCYYPQDDLVLFYF